MKKRFSIIFIFICAFSWAQEEFKVSFEPKGGVHKGPVMVEISAEEGATIYYSLDGSVPGSGSFRYKKPITVSGVSVIRAFAIKNGKRTKVVTNTYVCDREYSLAVVSIATNPDNLWDFDRGIYVEGCCADTVEPYIGANYWMDWEKPANIEMYDEEGKLCFNQTVGINLFGGFSRMLPQKSLAIFARSRFGDTRIRYPIFPDVDEDKYKSFILRNSGGDFLRTHLRDAFMTQLAKPTGVAIQAYRPAVVFINGQYWGIQNLREKISEHYLKSNFGVDKENVDILRHNGVKRHGYSTNYKKLLAYLRNNDLSDNQKMAELRMFMDVDDYVRYNIAEVYSDNRDAGGNIRYWRERNDSAQWRWVFYDLDLGLGNNNPQGHKRNTLKKFTSANAEAWPDPSWSTFIIRSLLKNKEVERQYINTFADHLNTVYHPDTALRLLTSMESVIDPEMEFHQKRWGSSYKNWQHHMNGLKKFIALRPFYVRQHIMEKFNLEDTVKVNVIHPGTDVCELSFNSLTLERNFNGIYFKGVSVDIEVKPKHDYEFIGWEGYDGKEAKRNVMLNGSIDLIPIIKPKKLSAQSDSIIFNEISFYQLENDTTGDWVELFNKSNSRVDVGGWGFTDKSYKKRFVIPKGTSIEANGFIVLTENLSSFRTKYPADSVVAIGDFQFGLSSKKETIKLYDGSGFLVDSLSYFNENKESDSSYTLALNHPDSTTYSAWLIESPSPSYGNKAFLDYLQNEADKKYWTKVFYVGGGSFFFILVSGLLFYRYSRKKHKTVER